MSFINKEIGIGEFLSISFPADHFPQLSLMVCGVKKS